MLLHSDTVLSLLVSIIASVAAVSDYRNGVIPNRLVFWGGCCVLLARMLLAAHDTHTLLTSLLTSLLGLLAASAIPLVLYSKRALGGGDLKLLAVCGTGLGPHAGWSATLFAFALAAVFALTQALRRGVLAALLRRTHGLLPTWLVPPRDALQCAPTAFTSIRFAPAILCGVMAAILQSR